MITIEANRIVKKYDDELLIIEPWGQHSLRVRSCFVQHIFVREKTIKEQQGVDVKLVYT